MTQLLQETWLENQQFCGRCLQIAERIASLCPRIDVDGTGFACAEIPQIDLENLFVGVVEDGQITPCYLLRLHTYVYKSKPIPTDIVTPESVPIPSSGITDADLFARLMLMTESVEGALKLWESFDAEFLNALIEQTNELRRDPKERVNEYLRSRFEEWKQQNQDIYKQALLGSNG